MAADARSPPPPGVAALTIQRLGDVISSLEGRTAQALTLRILEARSREECATFFGISPRAFDVMLLRAARALEEASLPGPRRPLLTSREEQRQAEELAEALEGGEPPAGTPIDPEVRRLEQLLRHLRGLAGGIRERIEQAERDAASSPRARWEVWGRRALMALLIAAAIYLYQRQRGAP